MGAGGHGLEGGCQNCGEYAHLGRRKFLSLLGLGVASVLTGCSELGGRRVAAGVAPGSLSDDSGALAPPNEGLPLGSTGDYQPLGEAGAVSSVTSTLVELDNIPSAHPGPPVTITHGPKSTNQIAITIDDGYCTECVAAYVEFARTSGIHITFSPNGVYSSLWSPYATTLRPLIEAGQVQIGNHTFSHLDMTKLSASRMRSELERNEKWIEKTFGITTRPWYRPPFGRHNQRSDQLVADLGYTNILMWNGSFGDAALLTPQVLMAQATRYLRPGTIMLGHANHPTVTHLFGQIQDIISQRGLQPVTLDEMFGTSRATG
jgi:peptidoglycan/xylan/chitin deacetylase (PgdA/CDA1 family)